LQTHTELPNPIEVLELYRTYWVKGGRAMSEDKLAILMWFMNTVMQSVQKNWPGASRAVRYYSRVTTSDEAFGLFLLKFYREMPKTKETKNWKEKLAGKTKLASIQWFGKRMKQLEEIKSLESERIVSPKTSIEGEVTQYFLKRLGDISHKRNVPHETGGSSKKKKVMITYDFNDYTNLFEA
jgi:hypothetical protein